MKQRFERRGLRWWWIGELPYVNMELGPFWFKHNCVRAVRAFCAE